MNAIKKFLIFVLVFLIAGCAIHYASFRKFGVFVWSFEKNAETGKSSWTRTEVPDRTGIAQTDEENPEGEGTDDGEGEDEPEVVEEPTDPNVISLFDGKELGKWEPTEFGGEGEVLVNEDGNIEFDFGAILTGVHWAEDPPGRTNYELSLDAMKLDGNDFFLALTFPVKEDYATFVLGGWGGGVVGISSIDDLDASENETMSIDGFQNDVWYKVKVRITDDRMMAWIDDREMANVELKDRKISLRPGDIELCVPIGIASFQTRAQYRNIIWKKIDPNAPVEIENSKTNEQTPAEAEKAEVEAPAPTPTGENQE